MIQPQNIDELVEGHPDICISCADRVKQMAIRSVENCEEDMGYPSHPMLCKHMETPNKCLGCQRLMRFANLKEKDLK